MTQLILFNVFNGLIVGAFLCADGAWPLADPQSERRHQFRARRISRDRRVFRLYADSVRRFLGSAIVAPILTAFIGLAIERVMIRPLYGRDPLYGLLLTFGLAYTSRT